jgi:hypothetical protein
MNNNNNQSRQSSLNDLANATLSSANNNNTSQAAAALSNAAAVAQKWPDPQNTPSYFLLNQILQTNSNMVFQAAITNRLLQLQAMSPSPTEFSSSSPNNNSKSSVKRKTHLSNCFMNDLSQQTIEPGSMGIKRQNTPVDDSTTSLSCSPSLSLSSTSSSPCSNVSSTSNYNENTILPTTTNHPSLINYYHQSLGMMTTKTTMTTTKTNHRHQYEPQQQQQQQPQSQQQQQQKSVRKINFGDIADLIN